MHCPGGNATDSIWRVLASSDGISSWTPLKPQHSNPNPNPFGQSSLVFWLPYSSHTSHHPSQTPWLPWISYATEKLSGIFSKFKKEFYCISFFLTSSLHFLKFTSYDNQALVGCILIPTVAVHLILKS